MKDAVDDKWMTIGRVGYLGKIKDTFQDEMSKAYGDSWRKAYEFSGSTISEEEAVKHYENSYFQFLRSNPQVLEWLTSTASEVYDNSLSNIESGLDYKAQEAYSTHLQDIAIRNSLKRLKKSFQGDHPVEIRGKESEGYVLNPGQVPFYMPEAIIQPERTGWWEARSTESFWQSNKVLEVKESYFKNNKVERSKHPNKEKLEEAIILWQDTNINRPNIYAIGRYSEEDFFRFFTIPAPYNHKQEICGEELHERFSSSPKSQDALLRIQHQLPKGAFKKLRHIAKKRKNIS